MLNQVQVIGHLGRDPEVRQTAGGTAVSNISVATTEKYKDQNGVAQESTEWHRIVLFGRRAEVVGQYLAKGSMVYVAGRLRTNKWQDQSGQDRYTTEIVASDLTFLDKKGGNASSDQQAAGPAPAQAPAQQSSGQDDFYDQGSEDIPF